MKKAAALATELAPYFRSDRLVGPIERLLAIPHEERALRDQLAHTDLIINASSVGMKRTDAALIPAGLLDRQSDDLRYGVCVRRFRLIEDGSLRRRRAANGLSMLLHQGALSFEIWFNRPAPLEVMRAALRGQA